MTARPDHGLAISVAAFRNTWLLVGVVVAARLIAMSFDSTDLYVDEAQYWLWGQHLDLGYFSKPPLIGWMLGAVTALSGSDSVFWVRMPTILLHGATALILAALARQMWSREPWAQQVTERTDIGFWVALTYLFLPVTSVGSFVIGTDAVMAPLAALALLVLWRLYDRPSLGIAALAGALIGAAMMAKYAGVYVLIGALLAAALLPGSRLRLADVGVMILAAAIVLSPNIYWNFSNDLTTLSHTADNASWVKTGVPPIQLGNLPGFVLGQIIVFGPIPALAYLAAVGTGRRPEQKRLVVYSAFVLILVGAQSLLATTNANWTFVACLTATPLLVGWLIERGWLRWLVIGIALNAVVAVALPLMAAFPERLVIGDRVVMSRYLGRAEMAERVLALADATGATRIIASDRGLLAALFHTGREHPIPVEARRPKGAPGSYYAQAFPVPKGAEGPGLFVSRDALPEICGALPATELTSQGDAFSRRIPFRAYVVSGTCLDAVAQDD